MSLNFFTWIRKKRKGQKPGNDWIIYVLLGVLLMVVVIPTGKETKEESGKKTAEETVQAESAGDYAREMEKRLAEVLARSVGVGQVSVMITTEDEGEKVVDKDISTQEKSFQESTYTQKVMDEEIPYVTRQKTPRVKGVIVVAQGAENAVIKKEIMESVMALFDLEINKIKVLSMG